MEKRTIKTLWVVSLALVLAYSAFGRPIQTALREQNLLRVFVAICLVSIFILAWKKTKAQLKKYLIPVAVFLVAAWYYLEVPEERFHFFSFGLYGYFSVALFGFIGGAAANVILSIGDEVFQHFLPDRVADVRDVVINLIASACGQYVAWIHFNKDGQRNSTIS